MKPIVFGSRSIPPPAPYGIYGMEEYDEGEMGGLILYTNEKVVVKDIINSYRLELNRVAEVNALREKRRQKEEERLKWERTHVFKMNGNTAPTNPWKKLSKPVAMSCGGGEQARAGQAPGGGGGGGGGS